MLKTFGYEKSEELSAIDFSRTIKVLKSCKHEGQLKTAYNYYKVFEDKWCNYLSLNAMGCMRNIFFNELNSLPFVSDKKGLVDIPI